MERKRAQSALDESISKGWNSLKSDYPDVLADPDALTFADIQVKKLREANPSWLPEKVITEAGKVTREKLKLSGPATNNGADSRNTTDLTGDRLARKSNIRPLPQSGGRRFVREEKAPLDMSPEAKIARMREGRALA